MDLIFTKQELDKKVKWVEEELTALLNKHAQITQITCFSKFWWNKKVAEAKLTWLKDKKRFGKNENQKEKFKQA